jgi:hypothetical protein
MYSTGLLDGPALEVIASKPGGQWLAACRTYVP